MGKGSSIDLENVIRHFSGRDTSWRRMCTSHGVPKRPRQSAVVSILQSQLHSVNGRKASADLTILPLLSTSEDLGRNTVLFSVESAEIVSPSRLCSYALKRNCKPNPPAHL